MFFGQKREVRLRAVPEPLAANTATSDSSQRLQHLVAVSQRVAHRIEKRIHSLLLVRFQHVPDHGTRITGQDVRRYNHARKFLGQMSAGNRQDD